ncbi:MULTISPECIES: flagellar basal body-associated protein FliL [unclassified Vibrio]|uniref:Flagellar protein FliL n=1 Tax=Vibrio sp. HB236076 TaxID=3232307 RepID=A0AB39HC15_9VIBR|nr:flagellar basal body-associated protein FliL [Vibrio sp. HB161653]MDP5255734.1 flagellar basal body-associated protein FliL [Vibrio sp. HB161653]
MYKRYLTLAILAFLFSHLARAEAENNQEQLAYYTLQPDITTNYFTKGKKLGYIQLRVDIMVLHQNDVEEVEHHQPLIRDTIIEILGQQTKDTIATLAGREDLKKKLVEKLNQVLLPETGKVLVADLLFTKYLYQE